MDYLRSQVQRYSELADIEEEKAKVLLREVQLVINKGKKIERFISLGISVVAGIVIFIFGIIVGPKITGWLGVGSTNVKTDVPLVEHKINQNQPKAWILLPEEQAQEKPETENEDFEQDATPEL